MKQNFYSIFQNETRIFYQATRESKPADLCNCKSWAFLIKLKKSVFFKKSNVFLKGSREIKCVQLGLTSPWKSFLFW